jgi:hypothetical protein
MVYDITTQTKLKLAKRYMTPDWGLIFLLPSLVVQANYASSLPFHLAMTLAWLYWAFSLYRMEYALRKLDPSSTVLPRKTWLVSLFLGAHPFNYLLLVFSLCVTQFPLTALPLASVIAAGAIALLSVSWYSMIFSSVRRYINERLPESEQLSKLFEYLVTFGVCAPAASNLFMNVFCGPHPDGLFEYLRAALVSSGIFLSLACTVLIQHKLAQALSQVQTPSLDLAEDGLSIEGFPILAGE